MRELPILFSASMVRAILEGRKTQTRRVVKPQPEFFTSRHPAVRGRFDRDEGQLTRIIECPYGQPGDRLWVRETWGPCDGGFCYRADEPEGSNAKPDDGRWHPSIHMFREASRITLEITAARVERLQHISERDAFAEGISYEGRYPEAPSCNDKVKFRQLWESINGAGSWNANPWVWVVEFCRIEQPKAP